MQIVIDIGEKRFRDIQRISTIQLKRRTPTLEQVIASGTPLPKGHGRLIDEDALEFTCNADECGMLTGCNHCQYHIVTEHEIDNAPTIIEADKED